MYVKFRFCDNAGELNTAVTGFCGSGQMAELEAQLRYVMRLLL